MEQELDSIILIGPFQLKIFYEHIPIRRVRLKIIWHSSWWSICDKWVYICFFSARNHSSAGVFSSAQEMDLQIICVGSLLEIIFYATLQSTGLFCQLTWYHSSYWWTVKFQCTCESAIQSIKQCWLQLESSSLTWPSNQVDHQEKDCSLNCPCLNHLQWKESALQ